MDYLINIADEIVTPVGYEKIRNYSEGMACVHNNNRNELINIEDYTIMTHCYDYVLPYSDGLALFKKGNKRGFIDKKNKIVIPHSKNEYRVYLALIFLAALPFCTVIWAYRLIRHMKLPTLGPIQSAISEARTITPRIFQT